MKKKEILDADVAETLDEYPIDFEAEHPGIESEITEALKEYPHLCRRQVFDRLTTNSVFGKTTNVNAIVGQINTEFLDSLMCFKFEVQEGCFVTTDRISKRGDRIFEVEAECLMPLTATVGGMVHAVAIYKDEQQDSVWVYRKERNKKV